MFRPIQFACGAMLATGILCAQDPAHPYLEAANRAFAAARAASPAVQEPARPTMTISFEIDGSPVTLHIDGDDVEIEGSPGFSVDERTVPGTTIPTLRLVDRLGTPAADLRLSGSSLSLRFLPRSDRAWLGVDLQPIPEVLAEHLDLDADEVSLVAHVREDSPAAKSGLAENDIVIGVEGSDSANADAIRAVIANAKPGDPLHLTVLRRGTERTLTAELGRESAVPLLGNLPVLGDLFTTQWSGTVPQWVTSQQNRDLYDTAVRNYVWQLKQPTSVTRNYRALFDAEGKTYVVPEDPKAADAPEGAATEDPTARIDRLEEHLARIEALLKKLDQRKDN